MEMHSVANLATFQIPLATFCPFKKSTQTLFRFWESPILQREVLLFQHTHTPSSLSLSLSLSLSVRQLGLAAEEQHFQLNTDTMLLL